MTLSSSDNTSNALQSKAVKQYCSFLTLNVLQGRHLLTRVCYQPVNDTRGDYILLFFCLHDFGSVPLLVTAAASDLVTMAVVKVSSVI